MDNILERFFTACRNATVPVSLRDEILKGGGHISKHYYYKWDYFLWALMKQRFQPDDRYVLRVIKTIIVNEAEAELFDFFERLRGKTQEAYLEMLETVEKSGYSPVDTVLNTAGRQWSTNLGEPWFAALQQFLLPEHREEYKEAMEQLPPEDFHYTLARVMTEPGHYHFFEPTLKNRLTGAAYNHDHLLLITMLVKDPGFVKTTIETKLEHWFSDHLPGKHVPMFLDYVRTGAEASSLTATLEKLNGSIHGGTQLYALFLDGLDPAVDREWYSRLFRLSMYLSTYLTLCGTMDFDRPLDKAALTTIQAEYGITADLVARVLAEKLGDEDYGVSEKAVYRKSLEFLLGYDFDGVLHGISRASGSELLAALPVIWEHDRPKGFPFILSFAGAAGKTLRRLILELLVGYEPGYAAFRELLNSRKQGERAMGVRLLTPFDKEEDRSILKGMLETEKSKPVLAALEEYFERKNGGAPDAPLTLTPQLLLKKAEKFKPGEDGTPPYKGSEFLEVPSLPKLKWTHDESEVPLGVVYLFLRTVAKTRAVAPVPGARVMAELFDSSSVIAFCEEVYNRWDRESKTRWTLAFISTFGDGRFVEPLRKEVDVLIKANRGAMASSLVKTLAYMGTSRALQAVDRISRKVRHRQVRKAANEALQLAAEHQGITRDELMDRLIPDFGFSREGTLQLDYGPRQFTVELSPNLELSVTGSDGKSFKSLPKPGKRDDREKAGAASSFYKVMKKELKAQVKLERERLEENLCSGRLWPGEKWLELFVENPVMHQFALGLIWGVYENETLKDAFRYMEDGSFNTVDEEEFELPADVSVGLVHPMDLSEEDKEAWAEQLVDYEVVQPFGQLHRPVFLVEGKKRAARMLSDFRGYMIAVGTLKGKLLAKHWQRGSVEDGGIFYSYYKESLAYGIGVQLNFMGDSVSSWYEDMYREAPVYDIVFYRAGTVRRGSYVYDEPKDANIISLGSLPPRFYSEIYLEIKTVLDAGSGFNPNWEKAR